MDSQSDKGRRYNSYLKQVGDLLISGFQAHNNNKNRNNITSILLETELTLLVRNLTARGLNVI